MTQNTSHFPVGFRGYFICGMTDHYSGRDFLRRVKTGDDRKLFSNNVWAHKPHTKKRPRDGGTYGTNYNTITTLLLHKLQHY